MNQPAQGVTGQAAKKNALADIEDRLDKTAHVLAGALEGAYALRIRAFGAEPTEVSEANSPRPEPQGAVDKLRQKCDLLNDQADTLVGAIGRLNNLV